MFFTYNNIYFEFNDIVHGLKVIIIIFPAKFTHYNMTVKKKKKSKNLNVFMYSLLFRINKNTVISWKRNDLIRYRLRNTFYLILNRY